MYKVDIIEGLSHHLHSRTEICCLHSFVYHSFVDTYLSSV
jgi:hypothetical protein